LVYFIKGYVIFTIEAYNQALDLKYILFVRKYPTIIDIVFIKYKDLNQEYSNLIADTVPRNYARVNLI
jgi:hypothetical protein